MKRPNRLWCEVHPLLYHASVWHKRATRTIGQLLDDATYCAQQSPLPLPFRVKKHQSPLIRNYGGQRTAPADPVAAELRYQYNKIVNLRLAVRSLQGLLIRPGETFSFWRRVGWPARWKGYIEGIELSRGQARPGVGGGICQITNLIHWLVLHSELQVTERHHHSFDPFPDSGRVLPFGSGATVFYNYLDFCFTNPTSTTFQLDLWLTHKLLEGELRSDSQPIYSYGIIEREHAFVRDGDRTFRKNALYRRKRIRRTGRIVSEELLFRNYARVSYVMGDDHGQPPT